MNIDYEAIAAEANKHSFNTPTGFIKGIIDAYEAWTAERRAPEWVPLDLATVKQGQEVRKKQWTEGCAHKFVAMYENDMVVIDATREFAVHCYATKRDDWLMRAPKPKTVRVEVLMERIRKELRVQLASESPPVGYWQVVGEGDIEVRE